MNCRARSYETVVPSVSSIVAASLSRSSRSPWGLGELEGWRRSSEGSPRGLEKSLLVDLETLPREADEDAEAFDDAGETARRLR